MKELSSVKSRVWKHLEYELNPEFQVFPGEPACQSERIFGIVQGMEVDLRVLHGSMPNHLISGRFGLNEASLKPDEAYALFTKYVTTFRGQRAKLDSLEPVLQLTSFNSTSNQV